MTDLYGGTCPLPPQDQWIHPNPPLLVRKNEIIGVQFTLDWDPTGYATSGSPMVERKKILAQNLRLNRIGDDLGSCYLLQEQNKCTIDSIVCVDGRADDPIRRSGRLGSWMEGQLITARRD